LDTLAEFLVTNITETSYSHNGIKEITIQAQLPGSCPSNLMKGLIDNTFHLVAVNKKIKNTDSQKLQLILLELLELKEIINKQQ